MARIVKHYKRKPFEIQTPTGTKYICQCGLSKNMPFCDSAHKTTISEEDDKVYVYKDGVRTETTDCTQ